VSIVTRRPRSRGAGFFVQISKDFESDMVRDGCNFAEICYFAMILAKKATTPLGTLYLPHEWSDIPGTNTDHMDKTLDLLEQHGKIVRDGYYLLVRSWIRTHAFTNPKYLKASLYALENGVDSPLIRFVIGTELLRLPLAEMPPERAANMRNSAAFLWAEITGRELPPASHMTGSIQSPNPAMLDDLVQMPGIEQALTGVEARSWTVVKHELRAPLQRALQANGASHVTQLSQRARAHQ
jgi:hypothetical protein